MSLRQAWDERADAWVRWARAPGHDSYWRFHGARFLELLPPPGYLTIDVGAGEGRVGRDLVTRGHRVVAIDASFRMVRAAASHVVRQPVVVGNAAQLPFHAAVSDLVVAFMSLHDIDDLDARSKRSRGSWSREGGCALPSFTPSTRPASSRATATTVTRPS